MSAQGLVQWSQDFTNYQPLTRYIAMTTLVVLGFLSLGGPAFATVAKLRLHLIRGVGSSTVSTVPEVTHDLFEGLQWVRANTDKNAVLAVNNYYEQRVKAAPGYDARYFYYAAFAERRTFLSGWLYSNQTHRVGLEKVIRGQVHPFPERLKLNERVFQKADPFALSIMAKQYGVTYLIVDRAHGKSNPALKSIARLVFSNSDMDIYQVI